MEIDDYSFFSTQFAVYRGDDEIGWFTLKEIRKNLKSQKLEATDTIWLEDQGEWWTLEQVRKNLLPKFKHLKVDPRIREEKERAANQEIRERQQIAKAFQIIGWIILFVFILFRKFIFDVIPPQLINFVGLTSVVIFCVFILVSIIIGIKNHAESAKNQNNKGDLMTSGQGSFIIILMIIGIGSPFWSKFKPITKWEYKTITSPAITKDLYSTDNRNPSSIMESLLKAALDKEGDEGWELVDTFLEQETKISNYAKGDTVAGLKPNIRPSRLVCILKRPLR